MKRWISLVLLAFFTGGLYADDKPKTPIKPSEQSNAWTPELSMKIKRVGQVEVAPGGKRVAYTVSSFVMDGEKSEEVTHIFLAQPDGTGTLQLTYGEKSCSNPQWSPDGQWLAFTSSRSGKNNLWTINPSGGEGRMLTDVKTGVGTYKWSPDSRQIAFTAVDGPTPEEEKAEKEKNDARVVDENIKMSRLYVIAVDSEAFTRHEAKRLTEGKYNVGGSVGGGGEAFDWSPDGKNLVFTHTCTPKVDDWPSADISVVEVATAKVKPLVATNAAESGPCYSPDGKWIAYTATDDPPSWAFSSRVMIIPAEGGSPRPLKETFDRQPNLIGWSADGKGLYVAESYHTHNRLYALPLEGSPQALSSDEGALGNPSLNATRDYFGFSWEKCDLPGEAYIRSVAAGSKPVRISQANKDQTLPSLGKTEAMRWKASDGLEIEGLITYPVGYEAGKAYPLLLVIHGGPTGVFTERFIGSASPYPVAAFAAKGYAVLRCNIRGSSGYGKDFRFANIKDWGGKDFQDLMAGVDALIDKGVADKERLGVMGWSYGGFMTSWTITQTKRFKAASVGAGVTNLMSFNGTADIPSFIPDYFGGDAWDQLDLYRAHSAMFQVKGVSTPTLIQHGEKDDRVPISQGYEFYNALKRQKCLVTMVVYPRTPHGPREPKLILDIGKRNVDWFDKHLMAKK